MKLTVTIPDASALSIEEDEQSPSIATMVRIPRSLRLELEQLSVADDRSLSNMICHLLRVAIANGKAGST